MQHVSHESEQKDLLENRVIGLVVGGLFLHEEGGSPNVIPLLHHTFSLENDHDCLTIKDTHKEIASVSTVVSKCLLCPPSNKVQFREKRVKRVKV